MIARLSARRSFCAPYIPLLVVEWGKLQCHSNMKMCRALLPCSHYSATRTGIDQEGSCLSPTNLQIYSAGWEALLVGAECYHGNPALKLSVSLSAPFSIVHFGTGVYIDVSSEQACPDRDVSVWAAGKTVRPTKSAAQFRLKSSATWHKIEKSSCFGVLLVL